MLRVENVNKAFGEKKVLNDCSFQLKENSSTILVGESGSGKTTLAKLIVGLEDINEGSIMFEGEKLQPLKKRRYEICSKIQYIFQDPYSAFENEDKVVNVLKEPKGIALRNKVKTMEIEDAVNMVDKSLLKYMDQKVRTLSGGQRQKLSIIRAIILNPKLIIADECTAMLDEKSKKEIDSLLLSLVRQRGIALLYISHNVDFEDGPWDNIIVIKEGEVLEEGGFKGFKDRCSHDYSKSLVEAFYYFRENGRK